MAAAVAGATGVQLDPMPGGAVAAVLIVVLAAVLLLKKDELLKLIPKGSGKKSNKKK